MSQDDSKAGDETAKRQGSYKFGSRTIRYIAPSAGFDEAKEGPSSKLSLSFVQGYFGTDRKARQNLYISQDGKSLIYYMASVCVVYDLTTNKQRFFSGHNDDVTCICVDRREGSTLVASGQKDPKDRPGQGKDMPKILIWDSATMRQVACLKDVCWGSVNKVQWSESSGILYMLGGDPDQTLKGWNPKDFRKLLIESSTMKSDLFGFKVNPNVGAYGGASGITDELVFFGDKKYSYLSLRPTKKLDKDCPLAGKLANVATSRLSKGQEKAFVCCEFVPQEGIYVVGGTSGALYLNRGATCLSVLDAAHSKPVGDIYFHRGEGKLYTCGFDQNIKQFSVKKPKNAQKPPVLKEVASREVKKFQMKPKVMAFDEAKNEIFIGNKSNQIYKYKLDSGDQKEPSGATLVLDGHDGQVWGLCVHPKEPFFATAGYDGKIKIWDSVARKCVFTHAFDTKKQFTCGAWASHGACLVFGTEDSNIAVFRWFADKKAAVFENLIVIPPKRRNAAVEAVSNMAFNNGGSLLAVAHMDSNAYVYTVVNSSQSGKYTLKRWKDICNHSAAPTHVQWSKDNEMLRTFTRDYEICHWKLNVTTKKIEFVPKMVDPDKTQFVGKPLIAGGDVQGLYQSGFDGTDLNDASITKDGKLIASGDDYGIVRLHQYPAVNPKACNEYCGHAEFVVGVAFLSDDSQLITVGGADQSVFQWNLKK